MSVTVILCSGQSNALGRQNETIILPANLQVPDVNIKIWNGTDFVTLQNGINNDIHGSNLWGPEAEFARLWRLRHPSETLYILKDASIGAFLADNGTVNTWSPLSSIGHFPEMETHSTNAVNWLIADGKTPSFEVLLWMQGEFDGSDFTASNAYQTNLTNFFSSIRSRWGSSNTKIMVGRIAQTSSWPYADTVRAAQAAVVSADNGNSALINTDNYALQSDTIHYKGFVPLGAAMYYAFETPLPTIRAQSRLHN